MKMGCSCSRLGKGGDGDGVVERKRRGVVGFGGVERVGSMRGRSTGGDKYGELHRIPGRMFGNGSSNMACLFTQQGRKGANQDAMIVWEVGLLGLL